MKKEYKLKQLKKRPSKPKVDKNAAKVPISLRLDGSVLANLKSDAEKKGIPYQTFIGSILHQYINGELIEAKTVSILNKFA